jgi:hypothetical protein
MTMRAVVAYPIDASKDDKELIVWRGIDEVVAELILDHDVSAQDVEDRCLEAIDYAVDEKARDGD